MFKTSGVRPTIDCGQSLTEQSHKESCSMRHILRQSEKTGVITHTAKYEGQYMHLPNAPTFHEAQNIIAEANQMFATVPAHIRSDFGNDPTRFLDFIQDKNNKARIEEYGLSTAHFLPEPNTGDLSPKPAEPTQPPSSTPNPAENAEKAPLNA